MSKLTDFLLARLSEDEARALAATTGPWAEWHMIEDGRCEVFVPNGTMNTETIFEFKDHMDCEECIRPSAADVEHISRHHPVRVLAECEAKRRIVEDWVSLVEQLDDRGRPLHLFDPATSMLLKATAPWVRGLVGAYADHPDFRQE